MTQTISFEMSWILKMFWNFRNATSKNDLLLKSWIFQKSVGFSKRKFKNEWMTRNLQKCTGTSETQFQKLSFLLHRNATSISPALYRIPCFKNCRFQLPPKTANEGSSEKGHQKQTKRKRFPVARAIASLRNEWHCFAMLEMCCVKKVAVQGFKQYEPTLSNIFSKKGIEKVV